VTRGRRPASLSPAHPCGCVRLRGSASRRRRKRFSPAPVRPKGLPLSLRAIGGLAQRRDTASALRLCTLQAPRTRRDLASLGLARNGEGLNHSLVEIRARELELLSGKNGNPATPEEDVPAATAEDDEIPF